MDVSNVMLQNISSHWSRMQFRGLRRLCAALILTKMCESWFDLVLLVKCLHVAKIIVGYTRTVAYSLNHCAWIVSVLHRFVTVTLPRLTSVQ